MASHMTPSNDSTQAPRQQARRPQQRVVVTTSDEARPVAIEGLQTLHGAPETSNSVLGGRVSSRTAQATERARERAGRTHRRKRSLAFRIISGILGLAVLGGLAAAFYFYVLPRISGTIAGDDRPAIEAGVDVDIMIPDGSGATEIAEILYQNGVIDDRTVFLQAIKRQDAEQLLKSGPYHFLTGSNPSDVVRQLVEGPNSTAGTFTVTAAAFLEQASDASKYANAYPFLAEAGNNSLEGFLFPKTYDLTGQDITADLIIRTMLSQYAAEVAGIDFDSVRATLADRYGHTFSNYEIITMASIIERETNTDDDRATVASVLYNRIELDMPLQSDATTEYIVGREVYQSDLEEDNPYNTYLNYGLTPTPICSPGLASIQAACDPEHTSYLFFYMDGDYHVFSETIEEHEVAIANAPSGD